MCQFDSVTVTVAVNGYSVETDDDTFVFKTWEELSRWMFENLMAPKVVHGAH